MGNLTNFSPPPCSSNFFNLKLFPQNPYVINYNKYSRSDCSVACLVSKSKLLNFSFFSNVRIYSCKSSTAIKLVVVFSSQKVPLLRKSDFAVSNISVSCSPCITICTLGNLTDFSPPPCSSDFSFRSCERIFIFY